MSVNEMQRAVTMLRTVELRRAVRGVDPDQARELLNEAADLLASAGREQGELRRELDRLRAANDEDAIAKALITATRAADGVVAEAHETAAKIVADAEAKASGLFDEVRTEAEKRKREALAAREQFEAELEAARKAHAKELESARAEADGALVDARRELGELEQQAEQLRALARDMERRITEIAQGALEELAALEAPARNDGDGELLDDLKPAAAPSDAPAA